MQTYLSKYLWYTTLGFYEDFFLSFVHFLTSQIYNATFIINLAFCTSYVTCYFADAFIQSDLQLVKLSRRQSLLEQYGVKGLAML